MRVTRSVPRTIAMGDESARNPRILVCAEQPRRGSTGWRSPGAVAPLCGSSHGDAIRGFLEDSSPTAIVVTALRASPLAIRGHVDFERWYETRGEGAPASMCDGDGNGHGFSEALFGQFVRQELHISGFVGRCGNHATRRGGVERDRPIGNAGLLSGNGGCPAIDGD
jgi:hypothetical protein